MPPHLLAAAGVLEGVGALTAALTGAPSALRRGLRGVVLESPGNVRGEADALVLSVPSRKVVLRRTHNAAQVVFLLENYCLGESTTEEKYHLGK